MEAYGLPCGNSSPLGALSGFGKGIPRRTVKIGRVGSRVYWQRRQRVPGKVPWTKEPGGPQFMGLCPTEQLSTGCF